jgi:fumarylpyruvate hydrolase
VTWTIQPPPQPFLHILGDTALFPVRRIWCVGRNYAAHAREMGADPDREPPFFFAKPGDAIVPALPDGAVNVAYPPRTQNLHHEVELVVAIGQAGHDIAPENALQHVFGYAVGLDLTRRDLQAAAKKLAQPWEMAKGFDASAPCSAMLPAASWSMADARIWLDVNGQRRQESALAELIWPIADVIAYLSQFVALAPGDVIFTGTPEGVGPLVPGDVAVARVTGLPELTVRIASSEPA